MAHADRGAYDCGMIGVPHSAFGGDLQRRLRGRMHDVRNFEMQRK
jgi:hypothetical protein